MLLTFKQIRNYIYIIIACCSWMLVTMAMEQQTSYTERMGEEEVSVSYWAILPSEIKTYIMSFLVSVEDPEEAIKNIKALAITSKYFSNFINDPVVLGSPIEAISNRFNEHPIDVARTFAIPGAAYWLKSYVQQYPEAKEIVNKLLFDSAFGDDINSIRFALNAGADVNTQDSRGQTPLWIAAIEDRIEIEDKKEIVRLLLNAKADVDKTDNDGRAPLFMAVSLGNKGMVGLLLKAKADVNKAKNNGYTPLLEAILDGRKEIVELLLNAKADVNKASKHDWTPLHEAVCKGNKEIVELLLNNGANVNRADYSRCTALYSAVCNGHKDIVALLLNVGANVNQADNEGNTPLHKAASWGSKEIIKLLLNAGAPVNQANNYDEIPLAIAIKKGRKDVVKLLRKFGTVRQFADIKCSYV
jgi:ankyrin repeat protein